MYTLSDQQIDFISNDISARGIAMVSLQHDLLDHVCCVIEQELEPDGNFEQCYLSVISRFFKLELKEIETETVHLLTNKNYYKMKKIMIASGVLSVGLLTAGILLKFLHMPGASLLLVLGIFIMSFLFLPLLFVLRIGEKQETSQKAISIVGGMCAMLISVGVLFKIMHWPGANIMCTLSLLMMIFIFIPVYFFAGFRNPEKKVNTIVTSIMMFTGCILVLTLVRAPHATRAEYIANTASFVQADKIVKNEKRQADLLGKADAQSQQIYALCEQLKSFLLERETGLGTLGDDFEKQEALLGETWAEQYIGDSAEATKMLHDLQSLAQSYNKNGSATRQPLPLKVFDLNGRTPQILNDLMQMQMVVLQNQRELVAMR